MQSIGSPFHSYCPSKKGTQLMTVTVFTLISIMMLYSVSESKKCDILEVGTFRLSLLLKKILLWT